MNPSSKLSGRTSNTDTTGDSVVTAGSVSHHWLEPFADTREAQRIAQLEADAELVHRAMYAGFKGRDWDKIADRLVAYGLKVMTAWIVTGDIYERCADKGIGISRAPRFTHDDAADLANETVARAFVQFRDVILPKGTWRPSGGASLTTYFIGQCLFRYANVHRAHLHVVRRENTHRRATGAARDDLQTADVADRRALGTDARAIGTLTTIEELSKLEPKTRAVVVYRSSGYSWDEIAELTGLTVAAAKGRLHRLQRADTHKETP